MGLNFKISSQIASLFDMYIAMGLRIAGKQDWPSLIIEQPLTAPQIYEKLVFKLFLVVVSPL